MAFEDQFFGITYLAETVFFLVRLVNLTEKGPSRGPPTTHQVAPQICFMFNHTFEVD